MDIILLQSVTGIYDVFILLSFSDNPQLPVQNSHYNSAEGVWIH